MKVREVVCGSLQLASSDGRRDIWEFNFGDSRFQYFTIKDTSRPLGNHFHKKTSEIFYFLAGGGIYRTAQVNEAGAIVGEIKRFEVVPGVAIQVPPHHTHRFDPDSIGTCFVGFCSKPSDPNDIIPCPIQD